jgi:hypothetical protein
MGPRRTLKADRLKRLGTFALAAPSHALVKLIHLSNGASHIRDSRASTCARCASRPDFGLSEVGGPKCKIWDAIGSDLLAGGAGGARLAGPRIGEAGQPGHAPSTRPPSAPLLGAATYTYARGINSHPFHAEKRAVLAKGACSTDLLSNKSVWKSK